MLDEHVYSKEKAEMIWGLMTYRQRLKWWLRVVFTFQQPIGKPNYIGDPGAIPGSRTWLDGTYYGPINR